MCADERGLCAFPHGVATAAAGPPPRSLAARGPGALAGLGLSLPLPFVPPRPLNFFPRVCAEEREDMITHAELRLASLPWEGVPGAWGGWEQSPWSSLEGTTSRVSLRPAVLQTPEVLVTFQSHWRREQASTVLRFTLSQYLEISSKTCLPKLPSGVKV